MNYEKLAQLLFPDIDKEPSYYEDMYPARPLKEGQKVTRFAPSPTGFLHIGGLFAAFVSRLTAADGVFYLRIEDTDKKREVEDGVTGIIEGLRAFGVTFDEGVTGADSQSGDYGPYQQSKRREIYQTFAKKLVLDGLAYPCFCTAEQLDAVRQKQEAEKLNPGYYGEFASCRALTLEQIEEKINAGESYVLRFKAPNGDKKIILDDLIKGKIEMPENNMDIVLLKSDGIPTYHFAHAVDDHLMRTTHVVRGDEWISSFPVHVQLFKACGFRVPKYAHISPIMKEDDGGKRKLSKRKDPEAAVSYYAEVGYPAQSVTEYLLTIANSNFEEWRKANADVPQSAFPFTLKKMSQSGALFDLVKLNDVSKNVISRMTAEQVLEGVKTWASDYDKELYALICQDEKYALGIFTIDRYTAKPRKDIGKWSDARQYVSYFYDEIFERVDALPENISADEAKIILDEYLKVYSASDDKDGWFDRIKSMCEPLGYTPNVKEFKQNPTAFKGHVGDISAVIRIAVTGRKNTPDLYSIMQLMGTEHIEKRIREFAGSL